MAIYQPFLEAQVSGAGVPQASNSFAGVDAIGRAVGNLASLAETAIEAFGEGEEKQLESDYISGLETARALKLQGKHEEARAYLSKLDVNATRNGLDIADKRFKELRGNLGIGDKYVVSPEDRMREAVTGDPAYWGFDGLVRKKYADKNLSESEIEAIAISNYLDYNSKKQALADHNVDRDAAYINLQSVMNHDIETLLTSMNEFMKGNDFIDQDSLKRFRAMGSELKNSLITSRDWTPEQRVSIEARFKAVDETLKYMEEVSSVDGISDTLKMKSISIALRLAQDPENRFEITPEDFRNYVLGMDAGTKISELAAAMPGTADTPGFLESFHKVQRAVNEMTIMFRTTSEAERPDLRNRNIFNDVVDSDNTLQGDINARVNSEEYTVKEWSEVIQLMTPSSVGDPNTARDPKRAKEIAVVTGWSSAMAGRIAREGKTWITESGMKQVFSPKLEEYLKVVAKSNPQLFYDTFDYLSANTNKYSTYVTKRINDLEAQAGITLDLDDGSFKIDTKKMAMSAGVSEAEAPQVAKSFEKALRVAYGTESLEAAITMASRDSGLRLTNRLMADARADPSVRDSELELARKVDGHFIKVLNEYNPIQHKEMFLGLKYMKGFVNRLDDELFENDPTVPTRMGKFAGLIPLLDKGEGGGDYDTLWSFSNRPGGKFSDIKVSEMTLDSIYQFASRGDSRGYRNWVDSTNENLETSGSGAPFGRYQFVPKTLKEVQERMGISGSKVFTPQLQDAMFVNHAEWVLRDVSTPDAAFKKLKGTWPGLDSGMLRAWVNEYFGVTPNEE